MSLWSALVASSVQRGRRLREAVDDELRASAHGVFSVSRSGRRPGPGRPGCRLSGFDEVLVLLAARRPRPRSASPRRPGRRGSPSCPRRCPPRRRGRGPRLVLPGTASRLPASSGTFQVWIDVGGDQVELDRGVDRDDELVIGEGVVRVVVAPQPLLAGRLDPQRLGFGAAGGRSGPVAGVSRALSVKTMPTIRRIAAKSVSTAPTRNWIRRPPLELARLGAALAAVAAQGVEQRDVDRDDEDRGGDEADREQGVDLVSARGMGRQSAAILYSRADARAPPGHLRPSAGPARRRGRRSVRGAPSPCPAAAPAGPDPGSRSRSPPAPPARWRWPSCGPARSAATSPSSRCRCGPSPWSTSCPTTTPSACARRLRTRYPIVVDRAIGARQAPQRPPAARPRPPAAGRPARPGPDLGPLALVPRALPRPALHPGPPQRALPARRAPAGRGLRPRLRRLLRGADRAALVVLRAGPDRGGGAADHGRGRRGDLGLGLAADVRRPRRQPLGGDALAALRHLADRRRLAGRGRQGRGARSAGATR